MFRELRASGACPGLVILSLRSVSTPIFPLDELHSEVSTAATAEGACGATEPEAAEASGGARGAGLELRDAITLLFTSGTSGTPKGALVPDRSWHQMLSQVVDALVIAAAAPVPPWRAHAHRLAARPRPRSTGSTSKECASDRGVVRCQGSAGCRCCPACCEASAGGSAAACRCRPVTADLCHRLQRLA